MQRFGPKPPRGKASWYKHLFEPPALWALFKASDPFRYTSPSNNVPVLRRSQHVGRGQRNIRLDLHHTEVSMSHKHNTAAFRFSSLPPEIRNLVCHYLFLRTYIKFRHINIAVGAIYGKRAGDHWMVCNDGAHLQEFTELNSGFPC